MLKFCVLASGSKGNATYVSDGKTHLLIDAGLSVKELEKRLEAVGVSLRDIDAVLITHEHTDHVRGLEVIDKKYALPVYINRLTYESLKSKAGSKERVSFFKTNQDFSVGDFCVHPFRVMHDGSEPVGFTLKNQGIKIGIATDFGYVTKDVTKRLKGSNILAVEANHDLRMLHSSRRPAYLKQRIRGRRGHLSNTECAGLIESLLHDDLHYLFLTHLSSECNHPKIALDATHEIFMKNGYHRVSLNLTFQEKVSRMISIRQDKRQDQGAGGKGQGKTKEKNTAEDTYTY